MDYRIEKDSLGQMQVPSDALYGAQTQRAVDNFPISGLTMPREFIRALGLIKSAAAQANSDLGHLARTRPGSSAGAPSALPPVSSTASFRSTCSRPVPGPRRT